MTLPHCAKGWFPELLDVLWCNLNIVISYSWKKNSHQFDTTTDHMSLLRHACRYCMDRSGLLCWWLSLNLDYKWSYGEIIGQNAHLTYVVDITSTAC